jgi:hypothetical protein
MNNFAATSQPKYQSPRQAFDVLAASQNLTEIEISSDNFKTAIKSNLQ